MKTVQRHIWKDYEELADDARYTPKYQELYRRRKETIEWVFADAKEKHAMRYTQYRGLPQVSNWVRLKFAAMNLKKLAKWKWRELFSSSFYQVFSLLTLKSRFARNRKPAFSTDWNQPPIWRLILFFTRSKAVAQKKGSISHIIGLRRETACYKITPFRKRYRYAGNQQKTRTL